MRHLLNVLLRLGVSKADRPALLGDLAETYQRVIRPGRSWAGAQMWYAQQVSAALACAWVDRFRTPRPPASEFCRSVMDDVRYAVRLYRRQPSILGAALLGLGATIGVSTAIFSILSGVVLRPVGVAEPLALVRVMRAYNGGLTTTMSFEEYQYLGSRARSTALEATNAGRSKVETEDGIAEVTFVSGSFFQTMGGTMRLGRPLVPADDRAEASPVAVVSDWYWRHHLGSDATVVGRTLTFNGASFTIVGVSDRAFRGPTDNPPPFWAPLSTYVRVFAGSHLFERGTEEDLVVWGRLAPGATREQSRAELSALSAGIVPMLKDRESRNGVRVDAASSRFREEDGVMIALAVTLVMTAIGLIVLLSCVNLANLLFASASTRHREIGLRLAIGATRWRLIRQLLTESVMLAFVAGGVAMVCTIWGLPWLALAAGVPPSFDVTPDFRVYAFLATVTVVAGVGAGLMPALYGTKGDLVTPLKLDAAGSGVGRRPLRLRRRLVAVQACACLVLLVAASLLVRSLDQAAHLELGFDASRLLVVTPDLRTHGYDAARAGGFLDRAEAGLRGLTGVEAVALVLNPPLGGRTSSNLIDVNGRKTVVYLNQAEPGYTAAAGMKLLRGRTFSASAAPGTEVVVTASLATAMPDGLGLDPIGQSIGRINKSLGTGTIVGVVADARTGNVREGGAWQVIDLLRSDERVDVSFLIRASADPASLVDPARAIVRAIDPSIRPGTTLVTDAFQNQLQDMRLLGVVSMTLGVLALCLSVTGIYGVTAFAVSQRTREIGVRMAIGATDQIVLRLLVKDLMRPVLFGLVAGGVLAVAVGQALAGVLIGVSAHDAVAFGISGAVLATAAMGAVLIPARRALRIQPAVVLRTP